MPNNCLNFEEICGKTNLLLVNDLKQFLINQDIVEEEEKKYSWDFQ